MPYQGAGDINLLEQSRCIGWNASSNGLQLKANARKALCERIVHLEDHALAFVGYRPSLPLRNSAENVARCENENKYGKTNRKISDALCRPP
jgi:hypothetical protein